MPRLTATLIDNTPPGDKPIWLWCSDLPSFGAKINPAGSRQFVIRYRNRARRTRTFYLGRCDVMSATDARQEAKRLLGDIACGADPAASKHIDRQVATVQELHDRWLAEHASKRKARTVKLQEQQWRDFILPEWRTRAVRDIDFDAVSTLHAKVGAGLPNGRGGKGVADRVLALISKALNLAEGWKMRPLNSNPCKYIERFYRSSHSHGVGKPFSIADLKKFGTALAQRRNARRRDRAPDLFELVLLTGCRREEILHAKWDWLVSLGDGNGVLNLPDSKSGAIPVDLVPAAMEIIHRQRRLPDNPYIFPSYMARAADAPPKPMSFPARKWAAMLRAAGIDHRRLHDLRHTFGTEADGVGATQRQIASVLHHKQLSTTEGYVHARDRQRQTTVGKVTTVILGALRDKS